MTTPTMNVNINVNGKALVAFTAAVYFAARAGTKKALKKEFRRSLRPSNTVKVDDSVDELKKAITETATDIVNKMVFPDSRPGTNIKSPVAPEADVEMDISDELKATGYIPKEDSKWKAQVAGP